MKFFKLLPLIVFFAVVVGANFVKAENSGIKWYTSFSESEKLSKAQHKYVLVDVYTSWCGWCKKLDKDVFSSPQFAQYVNSKFICVKANAEDQGEGQKVASENGVTGFPTALIFDQHGTKVGTIEGYHSAEDYINLLKQYAK